MRCRKSYLTRVACLIAVAAIGAVWVGGTSAEDFDWRNYNGQNWIQPVVHDQNPWGGCYAFAMTAMLETNYYMTRNDCTYKPDLATMGIKYEEETVGRPGLGYLTTHGVVVEQELPFNPYGTPLWPMSSGWQNRSYVCNGAYWLGVVSVESLKQTLKQYGPVMGGYGTNTQLWDAPDAEPKGAHSNVIVGYHDDATVPGGGYWILKNSWGAGWDDDGYSKVPYAWGFAPSGTCGILNGAAFYTGSLANATWTGGAGTWANGSSTKWTNNYDSSAYAWENKETSTTFGGAGGAVTINGSVITHGMFINSGSTGYSFSGGSLTVTAGGLTAWESTTISSAVYVGAPQNWATLYGTTMTVSGPVHTIISDLHFTGQGTTIISGTIDGGGMINGMGRKPGGLVVSGLAGYGRLRLTGSSLNFAGDVTVYNTATDLQIEPANGTATLSGAFYGNGNISILSTTGKVSIGSGNSNFTGSISKATGGTLSFIPAAGMMGTFSGPISGTTRIQQNGLGTTVFAGANTYSGTTTISSGALQADIGTGIPTSSHLELAGGVLQSNSATTFTRSLGLTGSTFRMTSAGGGFSSGGGIMTVNIGGGTNLTWGTTVGTHLVGTLKLSSSSATTATVFQNNINLNGSQRTIQVDDNPAVSVDYAWMSGNLSGSGSSGFNKTGAGCLLLTGSNTYAGTTTVTGGVLQTDIGTGIPTNSHLYLNGGILQCNTASTFTRALGTTGATVRFGTGGGGFAAAGTALSVNIGNDLRTLTWGSTVGTQLVGTLRLGSFCSSNITTFQNPINLNGGSRTIDVNSIAPDSVYSSITGAITGSGGSLTKTGNAILIMTGAANTYTGSTTITQGSLQLNKWGYSIPGDLIISGGFNSTSVVAFNSGQFSPNCKVTFTGNQKYQRLMLRGYDTTLAGLVDIDTWGIVVNSNGGAVSPCTLTINNSTDCSFSGYLIDAEPGGSGVLSLIKTGSGAQTLDGYGISYTGSTTINGGKLVLKDILEPTGYLGRPITTNATLEFNNAVQRDMTFSGLISEPGGVSKVGPRGTILTNTNTYDGPTTISGGLLAADNGVGLPSDSTLVLDGGVLQSINANTFARTLGTGAGQVYFTANGGGFAGGGGVMTVNLNGGATLTWGTTVGSQIVGPLKLNSIRSAAAVFFQNPINLNGAARTIQVDDFTERTSDYAWMSGVLSGTGSSGIAMTGDGCLLLTGANTYAGTTTISGGMLQADIGAGIPSASFISLDGGVLQSNSTQTFTRPLGTSGSTFQFTANGGGFAGCGGPMTVNIGGDGRTLTWGTTVGSQIVGTLRLGGRTSVAATTFQNPINLNGAVRTVETVSNVPATMTGVLSGTGGGLNKTGAGQLFLTAANTYTGTTTVTGGSLIVGNGGTTGSIAGSSIVNNAALGFHRSNAYTYAGNISGTGSVLQIGSGTTTLTGTNSYSGGTFINAGTLVASSLGAAGGPITVAAGTKLQMTATLPLTNYATLTNGGTVTGTVTLADNAKATGPGKFDTVNILDKGVFQPGTGRAVATAYCTGDVTWNPGGKYRVDLTGLDDAYSDLWNITGNLSITSTYMADPFEIEPLSINSTTAWPGALVGFDNSQSYDWKIAAVTGTISGFSSSTVVVDTGVFQNTLAGAMSVETRDSGHSLYLVYTPGAGAAPPVPEPSTFAMLLSIALGTLGVFAYRKRGFRGK